MQVLAAGMIDARPDLRSRWRSADWCDDIVSRPDEVAEGGGLLVIIARLLGPLMVRLFPDVPAEHPAMGAMIMNFSANVMGLGNAATPFGIRAMQALDSLNQHRGTATDAMVLFLAINTPSVTLLPTGVIALRARRRFNRSGCHSTDYVVRDIVLDSCCDRFCQAAAEMVSITRDRGSDAGR